MNNWSLSTDCSLATMRTIVSILVVFVVTADSELEPLNGLDTVAMQPVPDGTVATTMSWQRRLFRSIGHFQPGCVEGIHVHFSCTEDLVSIFAQVHVPI